MHNIRRHLAHLSVKSPTLCAALLLGLLLAALSASANLTGFRGVVHGSETFFAYLPYVNRPGEPTGPLVARYVNNYVEATFYAEMRYQPRQFVKGAQADPVLNDSRVDEPGPYAGWDVFSTPNSSTNRIMARDDWLTIHLNRPATLAVVWRAGDPLPTWLRSWQPGNDVKLDGQRYPTYVRIYDEGPVILGSVYDPQPEGDHGDVPRATYLVLFGESDGTPPLPPPVSEDHPLPQPNESCPAWVHEQFKKVGPDGRLYATWHPQIHPDYWCYFRHEHGSDPSLFGDDAPIYFNYVPNRIAKHEPHEGFKVYVFDDLAGHTWLVTQHMGTSGLGRVCTRFHSLSMAAKDNQTDELLFSVHFLGDYGKSLANRTHEPLIPPTCPDQAAEAEDSYGERHIGVMTLDGIPYEPWRVDGRQLIFGLRAADFTINSNGSTAALCNDVVCSEMIPTGRSGAFRYIKWNSGRLGFRANEHTKVFYTDPYGHEIRRADQPDAIEQYVRPGVDILAPVLEFKCKPDTPWQYMYACDGQNANVNNGFNLEGALKLPN